MVIDKLENSNLYTGFGDKIRKALQYLKQNNFIEIKDGRYEIDGEDIYASVMRYKTKSVANGKWESHKKYIDVQFIAEGTERIGYSNINNMVIKESYSEEKDIQFLKGKGDFFTAEKNTFAILFPQDVHMPGISNEADRQSAVIKVVVKVKAE